MTTARPETYTDGLGELIRAHRVYLGLSQRVMADRLGMKERSLSDIEVGRRPCPPGLLDTIDEVTDLFEGDVRKVVDHAQGVQQPGLPQEIVIEVSDLPEDAWSRAVLGRAAVESGLIMPYLGGQQTREAG